jgi:2-oxoglutarate dehydrogenase E2 component (dihydrolipoamide succinyltransferase)
VSSSRTETGVVDVVMPQLGVSVVEGTVVEWRKAVGDRVEADEILVEVSTDKIDTEIPAPAAGVVSELLVGAGETVAVGMPLARIEAGDALTDDGVPAEGQPPASGGDDAGA